VFRRFQALVLAFLLLLAALATGYVFLWFLVYLGILVLAAAWLVTRFGLSRLEAGFTLDRGQAQVGDTLAATYTLRNTSRLPKLWLEIHNPSTLPLPIPGRAVALGPRQERSWVARVPLDRRGLYRIDPMVVRTGDPLGLFESYATVGAGAGVVVYPAVEMLPHWRLPPTVIEGSSVRPQRTLQSTPLVTSIRPYVTGDAFNHIHWKSSARQQELQVKEFALEQTADVWLFLDLDRAVHTGGEADATIETAARACASVAARAIRDGRSVGIEAIGARRAVLPVDRGPRQMHKVLHLLAAVQPDGSIPLQVLLLESLAQLRRGMTAIVITASLERDWVRSLAGLRARGVSALVCLIDPVIHDTLTRRARDLPELTDEVREAWLRDLQALRHALAEHDLATFELAPRRPLGDQMISRMSLRGAALPL
jgi:uncharacterized protein (DUF58 family)